MSAQRPIRLAIADDHRLFRQGLKSLLASEPEVTVVGETDQVGDLAALLEKTPCDQVLLDLRMERCVLAEIGAVSARAAVVILTASESPADAVAAIRRGARAIVSKRFAVESLMDAIRAVSARGVWLPVSMHAVIAAQLRKPVTTDLSPREEDVVRCLALGLRNDEVGAQLAISETTVKSHLSRIFRKVGVRTRAQLVRRAARMFAPAARP